MKNINAQHNKIFKMNFYFSYTQTVYTYSFFLNGKNCKCTLMRVSQQCTTACLSIQQSLLIQQSFMSPGCILKSWMYCKSQEFQANYCCYAEHGNYAPKSTCISKNNLFFTLQIIINIYV